MVTIGGQEYFASQKLEIFTQLELARKLAPAIPLLSGMVDPLNAEKDQSILIVLLLAQVSDEHCNYIVHKCLSVVKRRQDEKTAAPVMAKGQLMFDDLTMDGMLKLTAMVIEENLGDFFRTALKPLTQPDQENLSS